MTSSLLASVFLLVTIAISFNNGVFVGNIMPIIILSIGFIILLLVKFKPQLVPKYEGNDNFILILLFSSFILFCFFLGGWWMQNRDIFRTIEIISPLFILPLFIYLFTKLKTKSEFIFFLFFIIVALIFRIMIIIASPNPAIDVYTILRQAPDKLLQGINPYDTDYLAVFPDVPGNYYAYWPASIILMLPIVINFGDPRVLLILADVAAALLIYLMGGKNKSSALLSLTYLFRPLSLYIIEASWLTPLNFFFICLIIYSLMKKYSPFVTGILLGVLTSIQFFFFIIFFFVGKFLNWNKKFIFGFITTVLIFVLPFLSLNPEKFFRQTILVYFQKPPHRSILIHNSLSLNTLFFSLTGKDLPSLLPFFITFFIFTITIIKQKKDLAEVIGNSTLFFYTVFIFGRQAFVNYYYLIGSLLILWITLVYKDDFRDSRGLGADSH